MIYIYFHKKLLINLFVTSAHFINCFIEFVRFTQQFTIKSDLISLSSDCPNIPKLPPFQDISKENLGSSTSVEL